MIVISDTTPIISLMKANCLELLENLYGKVLIPKAVYRELTENSSYMEEAKVIKTIKFISVVEVENMKSVNILRNVTGLDEGESEALIMYEEQTADLLLIDEHKGRSVAKQLKVRHIGTAGILMLAYDKGLIRQADVKKCLDTMLDNHIRLDKKICNVVMSHIGMETEY